MKKGRKRVGLIMAQPECPYQSQFLQGFIPELQRYDTDLVVFANFLRGGTTDEYQLGEANIYNLINFDMLDGIVIIPDSIKLTHVAEDIKRRLRECYTGPVVSVEEENEGFISVFGHSAEDIELLTDHVIEKHGCTDIAFMTGTQNHPHAESRLAGFMRSMEKHKLNVPQSHIFYGDFWYYMADEFIEQLLSADKKLPQAIICACDPMAISIRKALEERNIRVPGDVIVVGYDSEGDGITHPHYVTSLPHWSDYVGTNAARAVVSAITGVEISPTVKRANTDDLVFNTCGCTPNKPVLATQRFFSAYDESVDFNSGFNFMLELTITSTDTVDCLWNVDWFTHYIGDFEDFSICLCEDWQNENDMTDKNYRKTGYTDNMIYALTKRRDYHSVDIQRKFPVSCLLPVLDEPREKPVTYFFTPLHFNGRCFGYTALSFGTSAKSYNMSYSRWIRNVSCALESVRREANIRRLYNVISENETIASYYDLFSCERFDEYCERVVTEAKRNERRLLIISARIVNFENIRKFNAIMSKSVVKAAASALDHAVSGKSTLFRVSHDVFMCVGSIDEKTTDVNKMIADIRADFSAELKVLGEVGEVSLSVGCMVTNPESNIDYIGVYKKINGKKQRKLGFN